MLEQTEKNDWKRKYLDHLEVLESRERQWSQAEALLRQGLSRLSLAADGVDPGLDRQLDELRRLLRAAGETESLREPLERISESVRHLGDGHASMEQDGHGGRGLLGRLFGSEAASLRSPGAAEGRRLHIARNLLLELAEDLLGKESAADLVHRIEQATTEVQVYNLGHELVTRLQPVMRGAGNAPAGHGSQPHEVLLRLLEHIEVPAELTGRYEDIRQMLLGSAAPDHTEEALMAIAGLVAEIRGRAHKDRAEIESFLKQVTERLGEIDAAFQENVERQREGYEDGRAFGRNMDLEVKGIEESVNRSQDLDSLKGALRKRLDGIRAHVREHRETEERRISDAERQVERLNERLQSVQHESDELRRRLKEERDLAMVDPLTGIANRFAYNERLQLEVARWKRYGSPLAMAVWDIDRFKDVNDRYGHQAGDKALALIAQLIRKHIRETDFVARYGGEEFVLLLPETALPEAVAAAEHIRRAVMDSGFHYADEPVPITISCGISEFRTGDTPQDVFGRADAALYRAKAKGRNRCVTD
ncbi:GGDEF domain-containing protein [Thioalkalivibrio sp.]|uniref:GGDEF domain-containing protein n=1 Tax=Thioalkalivibrio sp. TaxID=2093813 RepID=UPI00356298EE